MNPSVRIAVDIGGTFTDAVLQISAARDTAKVLTTPANPAEGFMQVIEQVIGRSRVDPGILGAIAEFERARIAERVKAGLQRARKAGRRLGRPRLHPLPKQAPVGLTVRQAAKLWGVSRSTASRRLMMGQTPPAAASVSP